MEGLRFHVDDLTHPAVIELLRLHVAAAHANSPACKVHALDLDGLRHPSVTFWSVWDEDALAGMGALKTLEPGHAENGTQLFLDVRGTKIPATVSALPFYRRMK